MVSGVHPDSPAAHSGGDSVHRGLHIRLLRPDLRTHLTPSWQQMDYRGVGQEYSYSARVYVSVSEALAPTSRSWSLSDVNETTS